MGKNKLYEIIYEDEFLVVANKTEELRTLPDRYRDELPNLYNLLQQRYEEIFVVHRLDKQTSGVICFARTPESHQDLNAQFLDRSTNKQYLALVKGMPSQKEGIIDAPIDKHPFKKGVMHVNKKGKSAQTSYQVLETFNQYSLLSCTIHTGRTHQIRVHLQHLGCPLMVDPVYGGDENFYLSNIKKRKFNLKKFEEERPLLSRVSLHAHQLSFRHPKSNQIVSFEANPPKDFQATLKQLRKWEN